MGRLPFFSSFILLLYVSGPAAGQRPYFQQEVNSTIHVTLDDREHILAGDIDIEYVNHSPDTLRFIYVHLWPNAYQANTNLAQQFLDQGLSNLHRTDQHERGYIDNMHFRAGDTDASFSLLPDTPDIGRLVLASPLLPEGRVHISTPFRVKIPVASISRLGHEGQAYYITQWYPKPAVYDLSGWNYFSFLHQGEYYGEWGTFDVYLTLPANYVVAATGELQDSSELKWLEEKATTPQRAELLFPPSASSQKTLHYHAEKVHDFAWAADKRFKVASGETVLPSGKRIRTWAFYTANQLQYWKHALEYMNESLLRFSKWYGDYPWPQATAVDVLFAEGRDMEYPMMTLIGADADLFTYEITIAHELGHFWFYGLLGNNERRYGWMDEGLANYCETRYVKSRYQANDTIQDDQAGFYNIFDRIYKSQTYNHRQVQQFFYRSVASLNDDLPADLPAEKYSPRDYLTCIYYKPSIGLDYLQSCLGDSLFDKAMHLYVSTWSFRHPQPADMKSCFAEATGQDLSWFFDGWLTTSCKADYKLQKVVPGSSTSITLKNKGDVNAPFLLSGMKGDKEMMRQKVNGFTGDTTITVSCPECTAFTIDADEQLPEVNRQNNSWHDEGLFRKLEPLRARFLGDTEPANRTTLFFTPAAGYNTGNGLMTGGAIYNLSLIEKPFEYALMPMYGWKSSTLAGGGRMMANIHPRSGIFNRISVGPGVSHYALDNESSRLRFTKVSFDIIADIRQQDSHDGRHEFLELRNIYTATDRVNSCNNCDPGAHEVVTDKRYFSFLNYTLEKPRIFHPWSMHASAGINKHFYRLSFEYKKTLAYSRAGRGFDIRFFAGKTGNAFHSEDDPYLDHRLHMSGYNGEDDYLYDGTFLERTDPSTRQFIRADGGFAVPTHYGQANWLAAVNVATILHPVLPVKAYFSVGTFEGAGKTVATSNKFLYEAGLEIYAVPGILAVYLPLAYSHEIKEEFDVNGVKYSGKIRFEMNLQKLNPFVMLKDKMRYGSY